MGITRPETKAGSQKEMNMPHELRITATMPVGSGPMEQAKALTSLQADLERFETAIKTAGGTVEHRIVQTGSNRGRKAPEAPAAAPVTTTAADTPVAGPTAVPFAEDDQDAA